MPQPVVRARPGPYQDACGCFSRDRPSYAGEKKRHEALGCKPPSRQQLTDTTYAITACLESTRRCESAPVVSSLSSQSQGRWAMKLADWYVGSATSGRRGIEDSSGKERGRDFRPVVVASNDVATRVSLSLMRAWTWQMLSPRWEGRRRKT